MSRYPVPEYRTPQQKAEHRAYLKRVLFWLVLITPALFLLMLFGYSDQAPSGLRDFTVKFDHAIGRPVGSIVAPLPK